MIARFFWGKSESGFLGKKRNFTGFLKMDQESVESELQ